jgi:hypothetical protein
MPGVQRRPLFDFPIRACTSITYSAYNTAWQLLSFCWSQSSAIICDHLPGFTSALFTGADWQS